MKRPFRFTRAVSTLGFVLAVQPLSLSLARLTIGSTAAVANGGECGGEGGGDTVDTPVEISSPALGKP